MRRHAKASFAAVAAALLLLALPAVALAAPEIQSTYTRGVSESSADLHARIHPKGEATEYRFEYGTTTAYGNTTATGNIAAGSSTVGVVEHISGLQKATYHFRVVAINGTGTSTSEDQTFNFSPPNCPNATVRQQVNSAYLPDCRAYEIVSPEYANGATFLPGGPPSTSATSPSRLAFMGAFSDATGGAAQVGNTTGDLYVATRGATGWTTRFIGLPAHQVACLGGPPAVVYNTAPDKTQNGVMTDPSLSRFLQWDDGNPIACVSNENGFFDENPLPTASNAPYVLTAGGELLDRWPHDLTTVPGGQAAFNCIPLAPKTPPAGGCTSTVSASGDLTHFVFSTRSGVFGEGGITTPPGSVYDENTVTGTRTLISKAPGSDAPIGMEPGNTDPDAFIQLPAISTDGSRILMGVEATPRCVQSSETRCLHLQAPMHLYMRANGETYDVSQEAVDYVDMTKDGSRVYFISSQGLTADDHDTSADLFVWTLADGGTTSLTRLSKGEGTTGDVDSCSATWTTQCGVQAYMSLSYPQGQGARGGAATLGGESLTDNSVAEKTGDIFFYSPEQLDGTKGTLDAQNLYVFRNGKAQYVTTFTPGVKSCIAEGEVFACSDGPLARLQVSPDGSYAAFVTSDKITGYENAGRTEMYRYHAPTDRLTCISCIPDGSPPTSEVYASQNGLFMADDGRAFFSTADALVPTDTNEAIDVYEWVEGRAQLITGGTGTDKDDGLITKVLSPPGFYGVSADGVDVYFSTFERLVPQDRNAPQIKFYDARTNGGFSFNPPPLPCAAADECHGTLSSSPESLATATSAATGKGNANARQRRKKARAKHRARTKHRRAARGRGSHGAARKPDERRKNPAMRDGGAR